MQLSDDHHTALVISRRCRTASSDTCDDVWREVLEARTRHFLPHFELEERFLLPALEALGYPELALRVRSDHEKLRTALEVQSTDLERLRAFGALLHDHVRIEERQIFDPLQHELSEELLARLAAASDELVRSFDLTRLNQLR